MMERKEIVRLFLDNGFQLSEGVISVIKKNPQLMLTKAKEIKPRPFILTKNHLNEFKDENTKEELKLKKIKDYKQDKKELKINDYVNHFSGVYLKTKDILLENTKLEKLISINKLRKKTKKFSLIVVVREKGNKTLLIEDLTGEIHVFFDEGLEKKISKLEKDDIVGLICKREGEEIIVEEIIYPDVPVDREVRYSKKTLKIYYVYNPSVLCGDEIEKLKAHLKNTKKQNPIFVFGKWEDKELLKGLDNIQLFDIGSNSLFDFSGVKILLYSGKDTVENMLDKRLLKSNGLLDIFPLEEIPDLVLSSGDKTYYKNYKGATIISNKNSKKYFVVDLKNREVKEETI